VPSDHRWAAPCRAHVNVRMSRARDSRASATSLSGEWILLATVAALRVHIQRFAATESRRSEAYKFVVRTHDCEMGKRSSEPVEAYRAANPHDRNRSSRARRFVFATSWLGDRHAET
jgi:hypothetical protein